MLSYEPATVSLLKLIRSSIHVQAKPVVRSRQHYLPRKAKWKNIAILEKLLNGWKFCSICQMQPEPDKQRLHGSECSAAGTISASVYV